MPIYEYQCRACGHKLEALQKLRDDPLRDCPACSRKELRRCLSAPRFRLSGSGWYETDFKTGQKKNLTREDKPPEKAAEKDTKKDAKKDAGGGAKTAKDSSTAAAGQAKKTP